MKNLKKFWIVFLSFLPLSAGAAYPVIIAGLAGLGLIYGYSAFRSFSPVDMSQALNFFSTCWSCQLFADVMSSMSELLPRVYSGLGGVMFTFAVALTGIWMVWKLMSGFLNATVEDPWDLTSTFGVHMIKLLVFGALMLVPLPRLINDIAIEPVFNVGLSLNRMVSSNDNFAECVVATAISDPVSASPQTASSGAFSPKMRHNLSCEIANVHSLTGLGMTIGWTMLNMAFNSEYMHRIMFDIPIFPNIPMVLTGALIVVLFLIALLPVPLYFLEVFVTLSMDLIMLPLMLIGWVFSGWKIFPGGGKSIRQIIDDVIKSAAGIAMMCIFLTFAIMFLQAVFGNWQGQSNLSAAIQQNDSKILLDGLLMHNDSLITVILMGIFIAMFMVMIPQLVKTLFANVSVPEKYYETAKKDLDIMWKFMKKWADVIKK